MNWLRTILDGFAMTAYFNLFAAAVALYNPRLMFPCLPVGHYQGCAGTAHKSGEPLLLAVDLFWGAAAPFDLRRSQPGGRRNAGVLADGADRIYPVDDGKPVRPVFSGHLSHPEKGEAPFCHSRYGRAPRLWVQGMDEKLRPAGTSAAMAADPLPPDGGGAGRAGSAHGYAAVGTISPMVLSQEGDARKN